MNILKCCRGIASFITTYNKYASCYGLKRIDIIALLPYLQNSIDKA